MKHRLWISVLAGLVMFYSHKAWATGVSAPSNMASGTTLPSEDSVNPIPNIEWRGPLFTFPADVPSGVLVETLSTSGEMDLDKGQPLQRLPQPSTCALLAGSLMIAPLVVRRRQD
jgi:hypothetical protein